MRIDFFEWDENNIEHIGRHGITPEEVEEACFNAPLIFKGRGGTYLVYSQSDSGRFIIIVVKYRGGGIIRVITARDMTENEKRIFKNRR